MSHLISDYLIQLLPAAPPGGVSTCLPLAHCPPVYTGQLRGSEVQRKVDYWPYLTWKLCFPKLLNYLCLSAHSGWCLWDLSLPSLGLALLHCC